MKRCGWALISPLDKLYHDTEWAKPVYDDNSLFEFLTLEGAQAGLSWTTVLHKREGYRRAFAQFDVKKVAEFDEHNIAALLTNPDIIRNRLKILSTINNAKRIIEIQDEFGSFAHFVWQFVDNKPIKNEWHRLEEIPSQTPISQAMCKEMKKRGFRFVGNTICYAFMQACGLVDDHLMDCCCRLR